MSLDALTTIGSNGSGNSNFSNPYGLDTDGVFLYVADNGNNRIVKRKLVGGTYQAKNTDVSAPEDVLYLNGLIYVCDTGNDRISVHRSTDLKQLTTFGSSGSGNTNFDNPSSITTDGRYLYIADSGNARIVKYDLDLNYHSKAGTSGTGNENILEDSPKQIAYDAHEKCIYIVDFDNTRVMKWWADFSRENQFVDKIVASDSTDSSLIGLNGIAIKDHYVYLLEANRIQVFDAGSLTSKTTGGQSGTGNDDISDGNYIIAHKNMLIFSDIGNDRITIWTDYYPTISSRDTIPELGGDLFKNFQMVSDTPQQGGEISAGGTLQREKVRWVGESIKTNVRWSPE